MSILFGFLGVMLSSMGLSTAPILTTVYPAKDSLRTVIGYYQTCHVHRSISHSLSIRAYEVAPEDLEVTCSDCKVKKGEGNRYRISRSGPAKVLLTVRDRKTGKISRHTYMFRAVPTPILRLTTSNLVLGAYTDGAQIKASIFREQKYLQAISPHASLDLRCLVDHYTLVHERKGQAIGEVSSGLGQFREPTLALVQRARGGDRYIFREVVVHCPGDAEGRSLNELVFAIR